MRYELKAVAVWPVLKVTFLISLVLGFCIGLFAALFLAPMLALMSSLPGQDAAFESLKMPIGAMMLFLPVIYALFMSVFNSIAALVSIGCYNLVAKWGGLEFDLTPVGEMPFPRSTEKVIYASAAYPTQPPQPPPPSPPRQDTHGGENI